jgi:hypothetical protein
MFVITGSGPALPWRNMLDTPGGVSFGAYKSGLHSANIEHSTWRFMKIMCLWIQKESIARLGERMVS